MGKGLLARLDARDRALFAKLALAADDARLRCTFWRAVTHVGGATFTIIVSLGLALIAHGELARAGRLAFATLAGSHLIVQLIKRTVGRPRPSRNLPFAALIAEPDRFSFPSGHAAAAMSLALGLAIVFPVAAPLAGVLALVVGMSRVVLGVHYPGDVLAGQALASLTAALLYLAGL